MIPAPGIEHAIPHLSEHDAWALTRILERLLRAYEPDPARATETREWLSDALALAREVYEQVLARLPHEARP